jgi:hypothetical protein
MRGHREDHQQNGRRSRPPERDAYRPQPQVGGPGPPRITDPVRRIRRSMRRMILAMSSLHHSAGLDKPTRSASTICPRSGVLPAVPWVQTRSLDPGVGAFSRPTDPDREYPRSRQ